MAGRRGLVELLLGPAGPGGHGQVVLCARDPLTQRDHRNELVKAPENAVLVVDGVFATRPELNDMCEYRIWLDVDAETCLARGIARDETMLGWDEAAKVHRDRYQASERIYEADVLPRSLADAVVDNTDFAVPRILFP